MQIVIDIPNNIYQRYLKDDWDLGDADVVRHCIQEGTPLPKGHGEIIDRDKIEYLKAIHDAKYGHISWSDASKKIKYSAPTIIEADKEQKK